MKDLNSVTMTGRLTADPELRYTNTGYPVMNFTLAFNRSKKQGDEWVEFGNFIDANIYGGQAEWLAQNLHKGSFVALNGSIEQERWQTKEGANRSKIVLHVDSLRFMDAAPKKSQSGEEPGRYDEQSDYSGYSGGGYGYYDEDLPFD